jgi:hypothetical protein
VKAGAFAALSRDPARHLERAGACAPIPWRLSAAQVGLETFALGFPIHFDWSWRTLFNREWEDVVFAASGGSAEFRKPRFAMWIGYDF